MRHVGILYALRKSGRGLTSAQASADDRLARVVRVNLVMLLNGPAAASARIVMRMIPTDQAARLLKIKVYGWTSAGGAAPQGAQQCRDSQRLRLPSQRGSTAGGQYSVAESSSGDEPALRARKTCESCSPANTSPKSWRVLSITS